MGVHFLAELPLDPQVRIGGDSGRPAVLHQGAENSFLELARNMMARAEEAQRQEGPRIEVEE
jgi:hypothetical protein